MRILWAAAGLISLGLAFIGLLLPLLPTVPFLLLAAFCFARSSKTLHDWLLTHRTFGPPIVEWQERGAIGLRGKRLATLSILAVFGLSVLLGLGQLILAVQATVLCLVMIFIWSRPSA